MSETEIVTLLKPRYKAYLEGAFRQIEPTQAAMEYRKQLLVKLLDRTQELNIRGIEDPELIFKTAIDELGDMAENLKAFENRERNKGEIKRKLSTGTIVAIAVIALLAIVYVVAGAATGLWHPLWMVLLGGVFASAILLMAIAGVKLYKKKKLLPIRFLLVAGEALFSVFVFLVLQILFNVEGSWLTFLAMVALMFGVDTAFAFLSADKTRWIELPVFIEMFCVMLYVILGIALDPIGHVASIWHPGWVLCLAGVAATVVEFIVYAVKKARLKAKKEDEREEAFNERTNESYWTEWDD